MASSALQASLVLSVPLCVAAIKKSKALAKVSVMTFGLYMLQSAILVMPNEGIFATLHYTWYQKIVVAVMCVYLINPLRLTASECGFRAPENPRSYWLGLLIGSLLFFVSMMYDRDTTTFDLETLLFELSLPGISEEFFYRGLLIALWDSALVQHPEFSKWNLSAGALVSMGLFVLGHLLFFDQHYQLHANPSPFAWVDFIVFSAVMTWLRYEYKSVWPGVIAHNAGNAIPQILAFFRPH